MEFLEYAFWRMTLTTSQHHRIFEEKVPRLRKSHRSHWEPMTFFWLHVTSPGTDAQVTREKTYADRRWIPNFNTLVVFRGLAFCESACIDLFFSGISSFPQYSQYVCTRLPCPQDVSRTCTVLFISM